MEITSKFNNFHTIDYSKKKNTSGIRTKISISGEINIKKYYIPYNRKDTKWLNRCEPYPSSRNLKRL